MKYMPILPIGMSHLFKMREISSAFILPQFWSNPKYEEMYVKREWNTVIIDNAMYENPNPVPFGELIEIARQLTTQRTFIVAPEDHGNPVRTAELMLECIDQYGGKGSHWEPMVIVHGTPTQISHMFDMLDDMPTVAYGIAVSCWRNGYDRGSIKSMSMGRHYFHAMGLDSITEALALKRAGFDSVDSSIVATSAMNKIHLDYDTVIFRTGKPSDPVRVPLLKEDFMIECVESTSRNINKMHKWIQL